MLQLYVCQQPPTIQHGCKSTCANKTCASWASLPVFVCYYSGCVINFTNSTKRQFPENSGAAFLTALAKTTSPTSASLGCIRTNLDPACRNLKHHGQPTQRRRLAGKSVNTWVCRVNLCCCCNNQERQLDSSTVMAALHRTLTGAHNDEPCTSESSTPGSTRSLTPRWPGIYKTLTAHKPRYYVIVESVLNFSFFFDAAARPTPRLS